MLERTKEKVMPIFFQLLAKEEENNTNLSALKEALASVETLKQEVNRLRPLEERINTCQVCIWLDSISLIFCCVFFILFPGKHLLLLIFRIYYGNFVYNFAFKIVNILLSSSETRCVYHRYPNFQRTIVKKLSATQ